MTWIAPPPIPPKELDPGWPPSRSMRANKSRDARLQSLIDISVLAAMTAFLLGVVAGIIIRSAFNV